MTRLSAARQPQTRPARLAVASSCLVRANSDPCVVYIDQRADWSDPRAVSPCGTTRARRLRVPERSRDLVGGVGCYRRGCPLRSPIWRNSAGTPSRAVTKC